jgi:hypothetical protein
MPVPVYIHSFFLVKAYNNNLYQKSKNICMLLITYPDRLNIVYLIFCLRFRLGFFDFV